MNLSITFGARSPMKLLICMPTYNGAKWITEALQSILRQSFQDFTIIISDDSSTDETIKVVENIKDHRIRIFKNTKNLGYSGNLRALMRTLKNQKIDGEIIFLMAQDDILLKEALLKTHNAFLIDRNIGAVTRPYYWFHYNIMKPVRAVKPYNEKEDAIISVLDGRRVIYKIFESVGQLSGLAFRREYIDTDFHQDIFVSHIYPFSSITKKHKVMFLKDYTVAVRTYSSQTRFEPRIYDTSATLSWIKMFSSIYDTEEFKDVKRIGIEFATKSGCEGLIQIKTTATTSSLLNDIHTLISFDNKNVLRGKFWMFTLLSIILPRRILRRLVDIYKEEIMSHGLKNIRIELA